MTERDWSIEATLYYGAPDDGERLQLRPDYRVFDRLDEAVRFAMEKLPLDRRVNARIETQTTTIQWVDIRAVYQELKNRD